MSIYIIFTHTFKLLKQKTYLPRRRRPAAPPELIVPSTFLSICRRQH